MKQLIKLLCIVLSMLLIVTTLPLLASADDEYEEETEAALVDGDYTYELIDDGAAASVLSYTGEDAAVEVPQQLGNVPVKIIGAFAFIGLPIQSIVLPDTLETVDYAAFAYCTALQSVAFPALLKSISASAFEGCSSLETIELPQNTLSIGVNA
ncbi:MAG: leucine-rich repeat domain-containing protein, partial [Clostridia bacterium]|nr:leucine-rich repeat domain-containing protein [Clostridia bacterium]